MPVSINGTTGLSFPDGSVQNTVGYSPWRNRIINGDMRIDQRNNGASVTAVDSVFSVDRWKIRNSVNSKFTAQQNAGSVTPPSNFTNYLGITSSAATSVAASDFYAIQQGIEGFNFADLNWGTAQAQSATLSFWVRSSLTGTFGGSLYNGAGNRSYPFTFSVSSANTWEYKTITISGDTSGTWLTTNGAGAYLTFGLGVGSTFSGTAGSWSSSTFLSATGATSVVGTNGATFYITGVQLEAGSTATPFERVEYGEMLRRCRRYHTRLSATGAAYTSFAMATVASTSTVNANLSYPVSMRAAPVITASNCAAQIGGGAVIAITSVSGGYVGSDSAYVIFSTASSGFTFGQSALILANNNASAYIDMAAEL